MQSNMDDTQQLDALLKQRKFLEAISDISFRYSVLAKKYPLKRINKYEMQWLEKKFNSLITEVINLANAKQHEIQTSKN